MFRFVCSALFATLTLATFANAGEVDFERCDSTGYVVSSDVSGCEKGQVCQFVKGESYNISIYFIPYETATTLNYTITASLGIITVPIKSGVACEQLTNKCPADGNIITVFKDTLFITDEYVEVAATVKIVMTDHNQRTVTCVTTEAEIVGAKKPTVYKTLA